MLRASWILRSALAIAALGASETAAKPGERCRVCHAAQVDGYRVSGMARALASFVPGELASVDPAGARSGAFEYRFAPGAKGARILEYLIGTQNGAESARETDSAQILFTVGAGISDRSFVVRRGELMRFAPIEAVHDADGKGYHAQLSPGQSIDGSARWNVPVAEECLRCHTTSLPPRDFPYDLAPPASWKPAGIDCDACHAQASQHADWQDARAKDAAPNTSDPIGSAANPRRSGFESCARCHLQGDALLSIADPMRGIPGPDAPLFERRAVFVAAEPTSAIGFVSQVERLTLSACFQATRDRETGALLCTTCHDPHKSTTDPQARLRVRNACTKCHADDSTARCAKQVAERGGKDCVDCHMRLTGVVDVEGLRIHDHRIESTPPAPSPPAALRWKASRDGRIARCLPSGDRSTDRDVDAGLWMMAFLEIGRRDLAWSASKSPPGATADALASFHHLRADLREEQQDLAGAEEDLRRALAIDPTQSESSVNLGALLVGRDRDAEAIDVLTRVLKQHPKSDGALRNRGVAHLKTGQFQAGADDLEAAYRVQASAPVARLLSQVYERLGDADRARQWSDRAPALDVDGR